MIITDLPCLNKTVPVVVASHHDFFCEAKIAEIIDTYLDESELLKYSSFRFYADKMAFLVGRYLAKSLLSFYSAFQPQDIHFTYEKYGRPFWPKSEDLYFNISHTKRYVAVAIVKGHLIGVDIEDIANVADMRTDDELFFYQKMRKHILN